MAFIKKRHDEGSEAIYFGDNIQNSKFIFNKFDLCIRV